MTTKLPKGVITNSDNITSEIQRVDVVAIEDIARLWRVYAASRVTLQDDVGPRLENLFWRIWSNHRIRPIISGSAVATLFMEISEGSSIIRTTPTQSPRSKRGSSRSSNPSHHSRSPRQQDSSPRRPLEDSTSSVGDPSVSPSPKNSAACLPPPILKKSRATSDREMLKTARIAAPVSVREGRGSDTTTNSERMLAAQGHSMQAPGRRRTSFVANTAASRRRAGVNQRKTPPLSPALAMRSPSSSSRGSMTIEKAKSASQPSESAEIVVAKLPQTSTHTSRSVSPETLQIPISGQVREHSREERGRASSADDGRRDIPYGDWVVDHDFRSRFVDRRHQEKLQAFSSHAAAKKSAPVVAPSTTAAVGTMELGEPSAFFGETAAIQTLGAGNVSSLKTPGVSDSTGALSDHESTSVLPRTKSQLTLLLDRDRRLSEGAAAGKKKHRRTHS